MKNLRKYIKSNIILNSLRLLIITLTLNITLAFADNVLIIGGNRGIGLSLTQLYLKSGHNVYATYNNTSKSHGLIENRDPKLRLLQVNLLDQDAVSKIKNFILKQPIDIMIYNAGMFGYSSNRAPNLDTKDWLNSFQVNCIVPTQLSFELQDNLKNSDKKKIALISSRRGSNTVNIEDNYIGRYSYRSSKAALNSSAIALSLDLKEHNITILALHPGRVATEMTKFKGIAADESAEKIKEAIDNSSILQTGQFIDVTTKNIIPW